MMSAARRLIRGLQRLLPPRRDQLVALAYHLVGAETGSPVDLPVEAFVRQLDELGRMARIVPLPAVLAGARDGALEGDRRRPRVVLTFDDAYANFAEVVWPLLRERSLPATLFVPVGFVERECPPPITGTGNLRALGWEQLAEMTGSGLLTVGSHSWTHPDLRRLDPDRARDELARSRRRLEERLEVEVESFCYPRGLWNARVERLVGEQYRCAAIGGGRGMKGREFLFGDPAGRGAGRYNDPAGRGAGRFRDRGGRGAGRFGGGRPVRLWRTPVRSDSPSSLERILTAPVWLEERLADWVRRVR